MEVKSTVSALKMHPPSLLNPDNAYVALSITYRPRTFTRSSLEVVELTALRLMPVLRLSKVEDGELELPLFVATAPGGSFHMGPMAVLKRRLLW
ncbi:MAG: hypothetical protein IPJ40_20280 [Saprospirales bacterium]|nr:hypothetical protein [Saprospirales bacterium]